MHSGIKHNPYEAMFSSLNHLQKYLIKILRKMESEEDVERHDAVWHYFNYPLKTNLIIIKTYMQGCGFVEIDYKERLIILT